MRDIFGIRQRSKKRIVFAEISGFIPKVRGFQEIISRRPTFSDIIFFLWEEGWKSDGIFIELAPSNLSLSEIWEIKRVIEILRQQGKKVVAFLKGGGIPEIFLSDSCDRVFFQEGANFFLIGFSAHLNAFGLLFKRLNIKIEAVKSGELKSIPDMLTKETIPEELKNDVRRFLNEIKETLFSHTKRFPTDIYFTGITSGKELVMRGIGDGVFSDTSSELIKKEFGDAEIVRFQKKFYPLRIKRGKRVAIVNMNGVISDNPSPNVISPALFSGLLIRLGENPDVEGVVVRLNSRGGDADASEILNENIKSLSRKKKTFVSFSNIGASGGYLIASSANKIFSTPFSAIGSIGVFLIKPYVAKLLEKIGIKTEILGEGEISGIFSPFKKLSQKERKILENFVREEHINFMKKVSEGRGIPLDEVKKIADGSVFSGERAKTLGLVDEIKSLPEIVEDIKDGKKIETEEFPKVSIYDIFLPRFGGVLTLLKLLSHSYENSGFDLELLSILTNNLSYPKTLYLYPFDIFIR